MDHITVNGKELTKIKRLSPSHVTINKCIGKKYIYEAQHFNFALTQPFLILGDCAGLAMWRCLPTTTEMVQISVSVDTCVDDYDVPCTNTCTQVIIFQGKIFLKG